MKQKARNVFDWQRVREQLEHAADAPVLDAAAVLRERARRYAQRAVDAELERAREFLCFTVGAERHAIETRWVREVATRALTPVPGAPARLLGVTNLRGELLPVFDLLRALGRPAPAAAPASQLIVLGAAGPELAVAASSVEQVLELREHDVRRSGREGASDPVVLGVTSDAVVVLDGRALLEAPALFLGAADEPT